MAYVFIWFLMGLSIGLSFGGIFPEARWLPFVPAGIALILLIQYTLAWRRSRL